MPELPAGLTPAQRDAVLAPDPLLCVLAAAGAGKTRVLTLRVARRVADDSAPARHVLVTTFSRKAADELRQRLRGLGVTEGVQAGTFHRTALALLRQHRADRGLAAPTVSADRRALLAKALTGDRGPGRVDPRTVARLEAEISWAKARRVSPEGYPAAVAAAGRRTPGPAPLVAERYARYEAARRRLRLLDLDDLLLEAAAVLDDDPAFADAIRWRFRHLFVDEVQDMNPAQFALLLGLLGDEPDLFVVGDPHQSVYGWNGADPTLLARLPDLLPGTRVLRLDENHRSSPQVVGVAAAALGLEGEAVPASSRDEGPVPRVVAHDTASEEAAWVAAQVHRAREPGRRWSSVAVLARTNAQLEAVAAALAEARIPAVRAGGEAAPASDLRPALMARDRPDPFAPVAEEPEGPEDAEDEADPGPTPAPEERPARPFEPTGDAVVLTTFHRAKGLQWPAVFVVGVDDATVPIASARSAPARAEERRLLYVALTRAEEELTVTWAGWADEAARERGVAPRRPSPWLAAVRETCDALSQAATPPGPERAAAHLARIRASLATSREGAG
jgi:DNA helicase-2/ATP-dependent DNA helicase PcrA